MHHPQTGGLVERFNCTLSDMLATLQRRGGGGMECTTTLCVIHIPCQHAELHYEVHFYPIIYTDISHMGIYEEVLQSLTEAWGLA